MSINNIPIAETHASKTYTHTPPIFRLRSKIIALTGGTSGIGLALATSLVSQGAKVALTYRNPDTLPPVLEQLRERCQDGGEVLATRVDVRVRADVDVWIAEVVGRWGRLDGAANLAGVIPRGIHVDRVEELVDEDWKEVLDVCVLTCPLMPKGRSKEERRKTS